MAEVVARGDADGRLQLETVDEVRAYCYVVAGIVGELLTELFLDATPSLEGVRGELESLQIEFGEGLQLVNVLKDVDDDKAGGRRYVPPGCRDELIALARRDLDGAERYVVALARGGAPRGVVAFCALPLHLARATLDRVQVDGPGAKVGRAGVAAVLEHIASAPLDDGARSMLAFRA
jgi:farnesyl-diphosphate farnesyltransferase